MLCLRSLCCYALNCIHIRGFCKGLNPAIFFGKCYNTQFHFSDGFKQT